MNLFMNELTWLEILMAATASTLVRYLFFASLAWALGYLWFRRQWFHRKIIQVMPESAQVRLEIKHSIVTVVIFSVVAVLTLLAVRQGWTQVYWKISERPMSWWWASTGLMILLHDTWFYWTHRAMHHRRLFRYFHRTHHLFSNPTPWASFAFSPAEAVVQAAIFPLAISLMPVHLTAFGVFMLWQMFFNVVGHTGYEYNRPRFMQSPIRFLLNTPTNHIMHHEKMRGNYGLYFNFWDRLMGTNHPDYEHRFEEITSRPADRASKPDSVAAPPS